MESEALNKERHWLTMDHGNPTVHYKGLDLFLQEGQPSVNEGLVFSSPQVCVSCMASSAGAMAASEAAPQVAGPKEENDWIDVVSTYTLNHGALNSKCWFIFFSSGGSC